MEEDSAQVVKKHAKAIADATGMRDKDNFILVCCYDQPVPDEVIKTLRPLCNDIHLYQNSIDCISYVESLNPKEHVFLIVSASFTSFKEVHAKRQIDTIFLFELQAIPLSNVIDTTNYYKSISVSGNLKQLAESIVEASIELTKCHQLFNLYNHKQNALCNLSESSSSFLWFRLFKDTLMDPTKDTQQYEKDRIEAKRYMIQQCSDYYRHNPTQMKNIASFDVNYQASNAIHWYTSDSFIYKLINKALRTEDIEVLHTFRFFIIDLCANLAEKHKEMLDLDIDLPPVVYRGTQMTREDIDSLKENEGCLIATNGFLSTSRNYEVAKMFAGSGKTNVLTRAVNYKVNQNTTFII